MDITVTMTDAEFLEFCQFRKDKTMYSEQIAYCERKMVYLAKCVKYAVEPDPKKSGEYKISNQDDMDDLYESADYILASMKPPLSRGA